MADTFTRFRRELEDACTVAINSGMMIRSHRATNLNAACCCPLGTKTGRPFPRDEEASDAWELRPRDTIAFIRGFEGCNGWTGDTGPFYDLGRLYRRRFVDGVKGER